MRKNLDFWLLSKVPTSQGLHSLRALVTAGGEESGSPLCSHRELSSSSSSSPSPSAGPLRLQLCWPKCFPGRTGREQ